MTTALTDSRPFLPGTTGWTADDLADPEIERQWVAGRYEIVEGVLAQMPPALFAGGAALFRLMHLVQQHLDQAHVPGEFSVEVDLVLRRSRIVVADAVFMTADDDRRQAAAARAVTTPPHGQARIVVAPTLVIESISIGHAEHDRDTKRGWYAQAGIPNYWLLDAAEKSLECLLLAEGAYRIDVSGRGDDELRPTLFPGLVISLARVWAARS